MHTIYDTDLTDEHLIIIGKIMASWSLLEFLLTRVLANLIGIDIKECRIITRSISADVKLKKIKQFALFKGINKTELDELNMLITKIDNAKTNRNLIAHGIWVQDENNVYHLVKYSYNHAEKPSAIKMQTSNLKDIHEEIVSSLAGLGGWLDKRAASMSK